PTVNLGNDTTFCQGQTIILNAGSATSYVWSNGSTASSINISASGIYWVQVSDGQCSATDSIVISINQYPNPNLGNDTTLCQGQTVTLNGGLASSYLWSNGSTASSINASTSGTYWVQVNNGQCFKRDSINITFNSAPTVNLGNDTTFCQGQTIILNAGSATSYVWSNGSTASSINASTSGTYWVQANNGQCFKRDSINITFNSAPTVNLGNDTTLCQGQSVTLNGGLATSYLWSNGSTASSINASTSGTYWVQANNGQCFKRDSVSIDISNCEPNVFTPCQLFVPKAFTPNGDGINDKFCPLTICSFQHYELLIFNRWGELIFKTSNQTNKWDGKYKGSDCSAGVYIYTITYKFLSQQAKNAYGSITLLR
ncbi:MAG: gliding motility-associated C-terminal domain-containing protein, partial [Sphingobacteriales bacterium]|nr:gliding motility-associated C-terminal domain-containing protein [Sphingobacteriales bacterium]